MAYPRLTNTEQVARLETFQKKVQASEARLAFLLTQKVVVQEWPSPDRWALVGPFETPFSVDRAEMFVRENRKEVEKVTRELNRRQKLCA